MRKPTLQKYGDYGLLATWEDKITVEINEAVIQYESAILNEFEAIIVETIPAYNSLLILLKPGEKPVRWLTEFSKIQTSSRKETSNHYWHIPVCYDPSLGMDLEALARIKNISVAEIIELHTQPEYHVFFTGFLPGFLYLGGLDERLHTPRKAVPRINVPAGSVAIGGQQTGIYPQNSPGGWQIIGQCPLPLFSTEKTPPTAFKAGDKIKFQPIDLETSEAISAEIKAGIYQLPKKAL
jgi:inhibitor of KinA